MGAIKTNILVNNLSASQVFNMDETGVNQGLGPTHMYVPKSAARASQPTTDVKARITDVVTVSANGEFAPNMFILKHYETKVNDNQILASSSASIEESSSTVPQPQAKAAAAAKPKKKILLGDETRKRVVTSLLKQKDDDDKLHFPTSDWESKLWEKSIQTFKPKPKPKKGKKGSEVQDDRSKRKGKLIDYKCHYLECINGPNKGTIITSQVKAWNDSIRMIMYIDLILLPIARAKGKILIIMDNFKGHFSEVVDEYMKEDAEVASRIIFNFLPPNTTHLLQVLDLVVNGPIKKRLQEFRSLTIYKWFQKFTASIQDRIPSRREFKPPPPTIAGAVHKLLDIFHELITTESMKNSIIRSFVATGCYHDGTADRNFCEYNIETGSDCHGILDTDTLTPKKKKARKTDAASTPDNSLSAPSSSSTNPSILDLLVQTILEVENDESMCEVGLARLSGDDDDEDDEDDEDAEDGGDGGDDGDEDSGDEDDAGDDESEEGEDGDDSNVEMDDDSDSNDEI